jgi:plasmid segregation protein ParM
MKVIGIDIGFGFTKATNGREALVFKSIFGEASDIQFREQFLDGAGAEEHLHLEVGGKGYFVGELAERQSNVRSFTLDQNQFIASFAKLMGTAAISRLATRNEQVRVVTGLPISYYRRHRADLTELLQGKHEVVLIDAAGARIETSATVNQVRVIPQPFGSLFNLMLGDSAEVLDKRIVQSKVGIIDIGFRTSDYTIADRTRYSERGSRTTDTGIAQAFSIIAAHLREETGVNVELYRLYDAVSRGSIKVRGESVDLKAVTEDAFGKLATAIATEVERHWVDDWDIDTMVITVSPAAPERRGSGAAELHGLEDQQRARLLEVRPEPVGARDQGQGLKAQD